MAWPTLARLIKIQIRCLENAQILPRDHKLMFLAGLNFDTYSKGKIRIRTARNRSFIYCCKFVLYISLTQTAKVFRFDFFWPTKLRE